jgi:hypothetical protein
MLGFSTPQIAGPDLPADGANVKNGLYSMHIQMGDGAKDRASGIIVLRDGIILGGDPYFWSTDTYICKQSTHRQGTWKGDPVTNQHTPYRNSTARPVGGREVTTGFSGTYGVTIPKFSAPRWWAAGV